MRFFIKIDPVTLPKRLATSYPGSGFYKIGLGAWDYGGFMGEVEWINYLNFCSEPKYDGAVGFKYWVQPDCTIIQVGIAPSPVKGVHPVSVASTLLNPLTGQGFPVNWTQ